MHSTQIIASFLSKNKWTIYVEKSACQNRTKIFIQRGSSSLLFSLNKIYRITGSKIRHSVQDTILAASYSLFKWLYTCAPTMGVLRVPSTLKKIFMGASEPSTLRKFLWVLSSHVISNSFLTCYFYFKMLIMINA